MEGTWGGATTGGVLYSLLLRVRVPDGNLFCGGVGGLVVGAGPAEFCQIALVYHQYLWIVYIFLSSNITFNLQLFLEDNKSER